MVPAKDETNGVKEDAPAERPEAEAPEGVRSGSPGPAGRDGYRIFALGVAALVLFPILARSGIWDPYELDAADLARRIAARALGATSLDLPGGINVLPTLTDLRMGELPFTSMALGFKLFGLHDWTGRLPLAVWGFAGAVVLYEMMARLVDRRAGLYAVLALVTMPLYFMQARTMLGDIVTMSALTLAFCGLTGALLDARGKLPWLAVGVVGLVAGYLSRGLILGVAVPALSVGIAWMVLRGAQIETDPSPSEGGSAREPTRTALDGELVGGLSLLVGVLSLYFGVRALVSASPDGPLLRSVGFMVQRRPATDATFDLVVRQLGHALFPWSAFLPFALGRLLRAPVEAPVSSRSREVGVRVALLVGVAMTYGAFALLAPRSGMLPFTAPALLAAVAGVVVLDFERGAPHSPAASLGTVILGLVIFADIYREPERALVAFVLDKPQFPKTFEPTGQKLMLVVLGAFTGLTALAWWESQPPREALPSPVAWVRRLPKLYQELVADLGAIWNGNLVFTLVVVEAALVGLGVMIFLGRRMGWAQIDKMLGKNVADIGVNVWWIVPLVLAALPAVVYGVRDGFRAVVGGARLSRASFTMIAALIAGMTLSFGYYPALAAQLSPKEGFESYARLSQPGEPLALLSVRGRAAAYYGGGEAPSFTDVNHAFNWLMGHDEAGPRVPGPAGSGRRWLLLKADDLPRMNALFRTEAGKNLPILDGRSSQILLASNQLGDRPNESWLAKLVLDDPRRPAQPLDILFEDQLQAIGWEVTDNDEHIVDSVVPATSYHLRTYYKVLKPITGSWKLFVHIDGFQRRFNGDHAVLDGKYAMNLWRPGDVVVDDFVFQLEPNFTPGGYTLYFGFFAGDNRFKVSKGPNHENRAIAGTLNVR